MGAALSCYRLVASAAFPLLKGRLRRGHTTGFDERCGIYTEEKRALFRGFSGRGPLWLHAVSVGEVQAATPFVSAARGAGLDGAVVLSTVTETGARSAASLMRGMIDAHIYAPWDIPKIARAACDAIRPRVYVTVETEVWPNLLSALRGSGVPTFLLNARISDRTWGRARSWGGAFLREAYGLFDRILARSEEDAKRLTALGIGADRVCTVGDCKIDAILSRRKSALPALPALRDKLSLVDEAACFVAGSTHPGEEEIVLGAFSRLRSSDGPLRGARLILAPRHPERAGEVREKARAIAGAALFSELAGACRGEVPPIVVVDEIGVLFSLYALSTAVFVGGSLVEKGGQNILEPACWGKPAMHGPHMEDFLAPTAELDALGAAFPVRGAADMAEYWHMASEGRLAASAFAGEAYLAERSGAAERAWREVEQYLQGMREGGYRVN